MKVDVAQPRLWSPATPALHRAVVEVVTADGVVVDRVQQAFGIRRIEIDAEKGLRVNGVPYEMKGACVHHDNGPLGAAAIDRAEERRVEILKAAGYNAIRTSHNPPSPAFLDAADRLGMLVIDEAFDMWERPKNPQDYHRFFKDWWAQDLAAMVRRDRNHPSVVLWSIGNEVNERADPSGLEIARQLIAGVRKDDPTRPVTNAICAFWDHKDRPWTDTDPAFALLDVGGYNYQWKEYEKDHARAPQRVMAGTESTTLEAFDYWSLVERLPYVIGDFVWTGIDYLGESGLGRAFVEGEEPGDFTAPWPWHIAGSGDIDILGHRKPQSYYREAMWRPGVLEVAVHRPIPEGKKEKVLMWGWPLVESHWTWPGQEGKPLKVAVYSSCERVSLELNGKPVGEKPTTRAERRQNEFEVPYAPGALAATCTGAGDPKTRVELVTAGPPATLRLTADRGEIRASRNDLSYVRIEVVDAKGTVVPGARPQIVATVTGPGELAALGERGPGRPRRLPQARRAGRTGASRRPSCDRPARGGSSSWPRPRAFPRRASGSLRDDPWRAADPPARQDRGTSGWQVASWTWSTTARTASTGVPGRMPWPRLKTWPGRPPARRSTSSTRARSRSRGAKRSVGSRFPWTATPSPARFHPSSRGVRQSTPITVPPASRCTASRWPVPVPKWIFGTSRSAIPSKMRRTCGSTNSR